MPFKINISEKGKTFKLETDTEFLIGKKIGEKIEGKELKPELEGYELEITGTSDKAGFPGMKQAEGIALKKVLFTKGFGMKKRPRKEGEGKPRRMAKGMRLKKTIRGNTISRDTIQINIKVLKAGNKKLEQIMPKTETPAEGEAEKETEKKPEQTPAEQPKPEVKEEKQEPKAEEKKEETKPEQTEQ